MGQRIGFKPLRIFKPTSVLESSETPLTHATAQNNNDMNKLERMGEVHKRPLSDIEQSTGEHNRMKFV